MMAADDKTGSRTSSNSEETSSFIRIIPQNGNISNKNDARITFRIHDPRHVPTYAAIWNITGKYGCSK